MSKLKVLFRALELAQEEIESLNDSIGDLVDEIADLSEALERSQLENAKLRENLREAENKENPYEYGAQGDEPWDNEPHMPIVFSPELDEPNFPY